MEKGMNENDFNVLLTRFRRDEQHQIILENKISNYQKAKSLLQKMMSKPLKNEYDFLDIYSRIVDPPGLWTSGWLFRNKTKIAKNFSRFVELIKMVDTVEEIDVGLFTPALNIAKQVPGLGLNVLTEILMTFYPDTFPVLNNNSRASLRYLGYDNSLPTKKLAVKPDHYFHFQQYVFTHVLKKCGFDSFMESDVFLSFLYWHETK
jgi:hypothetical protein